MKHFIHSISFVAALLVLQVAVGVANSAVFADACHLTEQSDTNASVFGTCTTSNFVSDPTKSLGTGSAEVDITSGTLRAKATSHAFGFTAPGTLPVVVNRGGAGASIFDRIIIEGLTDAAQNVRLSLRVDGLVIGHAATGIPFLNVALAASSEIRFLEANTDFSSVTRASAQGIVSFTSGHVQIVLTGTGAPEASMQVISSSQGLVSFILHLDKSVSASENEFDFLASLSVSGQNSEAGFTTVSFDNTARLSIAVPDGLLFESESGALLTNPVPLPASLWLFGVACVTLFRRRFFRTQICASMRG